MNNLSAPIAANTNRDILDLEMSKRTDATTQDGQARAVEALTAAARHRNIACDFFRSEDGHKAYQAHFCAHDRYAAAAYFYEQGLNALGDGEFKAAKKAASRAKSIGGETAEPTGTLPAIKVN